MRPTSKQHQAKDNWASLLQEEIQNAGTKFPPNSKTAAEIMAMRKAAGLPHGTCSTQRWLKDMVGTGKLQMIDGHVIGGNGKLVRCVKYVVVE